MKKERFNKAFNYLKSKGIVHTQKDLSKVIGIDQGNLSNALKGIDKYLTDSFLEKFNNAFNDIFNIEWLTTGEGNMLKDDSHQMQDRVADNYKSLVEKLHKIIREQEIIIESNNKELASISDKTDISTRPRIPLNAAAGSVSVALSGVKLEDTEQLPFIHAFSNYNYTILVKGDSMEPEFHSGDELACLQLTNGKAKFIQWGRYHVLDTAQGVVVKRIYDSGEHILCKSENNELYPDFKIYKEDIYNIGLVIGMLRRF